MPAIQIGPNGILVNVPQRLVDSYQSGQLSATGMKDQVLSMSHRDPGAIGLEQPLKPSDLGLEDADPVRADGALNAAMISAGKEVNRIGSNVKELFTTDPSRKAEEQARQAEMQRMTAPVREEYPKSSFAGEILPGFAVPGGKAVQMAAGATLAGLEGEGTDRLTNAALGAGTSLLGSWVGDRIGGRLLNRVQQLFRVSKAAPREVLENAGIRMTPGQRGSAVGRATDVARSTISGRQPLYRQQISRLNRLASRVVGENSDELTPEVLGRAARRIGDVFESASSRVDGKLPLDASDVIPRMTKAVEEVTDPAKVAGAMRIFRKAIEEGVDGRRYVDLRSKLGKMSTQLWANGNGIEAEVIDSMIDTLDDAVQATVTDLAEDLTAARGQWRFLTALRRGAALDPEGNINITSLNRAIDSKYPNADIGVFPEGQAGDFIEVMKAFRSVIRPFRSSGTAERAAQIAGIGTAATGVAAGSPAIAAGPLVVGAAPFMGGGAGSVVGGGAARGATDPLVEALMQRR